MPATALNPDRAVPKKFIGAVKDEWRLYSNHASDYAIGAIIGFGASSVVYSAQYHAKEEPRPIPCALKVLDLDRLPPRSLRLLQRETQLMSLSKHPNVLRVRGTWTEGHKLYIALRLMKSGSAADVMRYGWPGGMEEEVVRCILKQALEGLKLVRLPSLFLNCLIPLILVISMSMVSSIVTSKQLTCSSTTMGLSSSGTLELPRSSGTRRAHIPAPATSPEALILIPSHAPIIPTNAEQPGPPSLSGRLF